MLSFDDDVTVEIQTVRQERSLGFFAAVRHEQDRRRWSNGHPDDVRLVVRSFCGEYACRKKNMGNDVARQTEIVSGNQIVRLNSAFLKQALQSPMNT
jgi:hypothetical protein